MKKLKTAPCTGSSMDVKYIFSKKQDMDFTLNHLYVFMVGDIDGAVYYQ